MADCNPDEMICTVVWSDSKTKNVGQASVTMPRHWHASPDSREDIVAHVIGVAEKARKACMDSQ